MTLQLENTAIQAFSGTGAETILFGRTAVDLYITSNSGTSFSVDGGTTFMSLPDSKMHTFKNVRLNKIVFNSGIWSGFAVSY